jgi:16S rRNA (guanine527-N7)-methyltransferase
VSADRLLGEEISRYELKISQEAERRLGHYLRELQHWNRTLNLTSLRGAQLVRRLVAEPIWIGQELQVSGRLADIGSGNGSPGLPLYVACGLTAAHLVEARAKRAAFLRHVAAEMDGRRIFVHKARVEDIETIEAVDWITLQAVTPSKSLMASLRRLFPPTTRVVWITARGEAPPSAATRLSVPGSETEAWVFNLDQF